MKQVLQHARTGEIDIVEVPLPRVLEGCVLVQVAASLVSAGTERASAEFAHKNLLQKAKARPDLVSQVIDKVRRDGLLSAWASVRSRLDQPSVLGYSCAGTVVQVGEGVTGISVGDRVACAGVGYATHGEYACVPRLLVAKISSVSGMSFDEAAFTTVGAVALHGIRTADAKVGDTIAVIGLGLLGQLTVQLLKAAGCRVVGVDLLSARVHLALGMGADAASAAPLEFRDLCLQHSAGRGVDAVLITADTVSDDPVNLAAEVARDRATVVAVGTVGMDIPRRLYYGKELDFRISRSFGPGRYDSSYEQKGIDYPIGYVRWTETRNMEAFLQLAGEKKLNLQPLITHRFPIERASAAYDIITSGAEPFLGVLITYDERPQGCDSLKLVEKKSSDIRSADSVKVGLLGTGNFAASTLIPAMMASEEVELVGVCGSNGVRSRHIGENFDFQYCTTEEEKILSDPGINTVVIATRHHLHAAQTLSALGVGKHVFCEKPLCLTEGELAAIVRAHESLSEKTLLAVGFNRRFAPMAKRMKEFLKAVHEPIALHYRVNAGPLAPDHWVNDPAQGGGRILGEVCHFIDFLGFLVGAPPIEVETRDITSSNPYAGDNVVLSLRYADGSYGTISYLSSGDRSYAKERLEVFGGGAVAVLDDFRKLELVRDGKKQVFRSRFRQDKGHRGEWAAFISSIRGGTEAPIPFREIVESTLATLRALDSRASGKPAVIDVPAFRSASLTAGD